MTVNVAEGATLPYLGYVEVKVKVDFLTRGGIICPIVGYIPRLIIIEKLPVKVGTNTIRIYKTCMSGSHVNSVRKGMELNISLY